MVDAVVSYAIENVGKILSEEGRLLFGVRDKVEEMQNELKRMQCFLKDAERRKGESDSVRNWVSEIREVAYDVEDVIEHFVLKSALRNQQGVMNFINKYASCINHGVELRQMSSRIERIKSNLSSLRDSLQTYGITRELGVVPVVSTRKRQDYAHITAINVVGLDEKVTELVLHLLDEEASVVCVYGMGGLGKTTAAKQVYNDRRIRAHFEGFAWVYISQQFIKRLVWESILTQLSDKTKKEVEKMSNEDITSQLWHIQKEKKCLIVIDDIWRNQDWENLFAATFPGMEMENRSKILVTSRNEYVVSHRVWRTTLDILDEITSFKLLKDTILFLGGSNHPIKESSKLDKCAEEMVIECGGLPLAIIVLGGILAAKHELSEWERVGANIRSYLSRGDPNMSGGVARVLESSFEDLPCHLKSCFLYFSQYREDEEIKRSELVQKWIGEGFVSTSMDETAEEVAEDYLNELVSRCMVQVVTRGHTGRVNKCRMHDLVRDLCVSKARDEGFGQSITLMGEDNDGTNLGKVNSHRLCASFVGTRFKINESNLSSSHFPQLRSICFHTDDHDQKQHYGDQCRVMKLISKKMKSVRVLEVPHPHWRWIGKLRNLIHLRFLKLEVGWKATSIRFGDMRCLQTLNLAKREWGVTIPNSLWEMEQLRHLYLPYRTWCESSKQRVGSFQNLQTLVNFPPLNFDLQQNLCKFSGVRKLVLGHHIDEIDEIVRSQGISFNRLQSLSFHPIVYDKIHLEAIPRASPRLYRLYCKGHIHSSATSSCTWPSNLTKLVIEHSELDESCFGHLAKLQSLRVLFLRIYSFTCKEMMFCEDGFPQLRHLKLESLFELEACIVQEGALPSLVCLEIEDCRKLEFVHGFKVLKVLKEIKVEYMPSAFVQRLEQERGESRVLSIFSSYCDKDKYENQPFPYSWQLG